MKIGIVIRRFLIPQSFISLYYLLKYRCKVSPRAEVELSPTLEIGRGTQVSSFCKIKAHGGLLRIGREVTIGASSFIATWKGGIEIGDYAILGPGVSVVASNYRFDRSDIPIVHQGSTSKGIRIGRDAWLGAGVVVLDGATIGDGAIVGAGAVVTGEIPPLAIAAGVPAKVIGSRSTGAAPSAPAVELR
jgi:acetyltransferase-like isoleucine patch superfamily enzyme